MDPEFKNPSIYYRCQIDAEKLETWDDVKAHTEETGHTSFKAIERKEDETV